MSRFTKLPLLQRDNTVACLTWNVVAYDGMARRATSLSKLGLVPSLSAGFGMGKSTVFHRFEERVKHMATYDPDTLMAPAVAAKLPDEFCRDEVARLAAGRFTVVQLTLFDSLGRLANQLVAAVRGLGLDGLTDVPNIRCETNAQFLCDVGELLLQLASAPWTQETNTLFVFVDEAMAKELDFMRSLRTHMATFYEHARSVLRGAEARGEATPDTAWRRMPRVQLVLASAKLADRPADHSSQVQHHNWLSLTPLNTASVCAIREALSAQGSLRVSGHRGRCRASQKVLTVVEVVFCWRCSAWIKASLPPPT